MASLAVLLNELDEDATPTLRAVVPNSLSAEVSPARPDAPGADQEVVGV